ncbi:MAG: MFS transporter, partial [Burkholderiales bacterium]
AGQGISASAIGLIIAMSAAGGFLARIILPQLIARVGALRLFGLALALGGVCLAIVPFANGALALGIISFIFGCGLNVSQPISLTLMYNRSPKGRSGAGLGLRFAVDNASRLVTPMLFGAATAFMGIGAVFWLNAALLGLGGLVAKLEGKD